MRRILCALLLGTLGVGTFTPATASASERNTVVAIRHDRGPHHRHHHRGHKHGHGHRRHAR